MGDNGTPAACTEARERFAAFLDGELSAAEGATLEAHLRVCAECRQESQAVAELDRDFNVLAVQTEHVLEEQVRAVLQRVRDEAASVTPLPLRVPSTRFRSVPPSRSRRLLQPALLVASVLVGTAVLFALFSHAIRRPPVPPAGEPVHDEALRTQEERRVQEDLVRREEERQRRYEEMKRAEAECLASQAVLRQLEEDQRRLDEAMRQAAEEQKRQENDRAMKEFLARMDEERRRAEADFQAKQDAEARAREDLERAEQERQVAQARSREVARPKKAVRPVRSPLAVAPLVAAPIQVDPITVDRAIGRGVEYLKGRLEGLLGWRGEARSLELVLWALLHAGVPESDLDFQALLRGMLESRLERTYNAALQAMILEELNRVKHQVRIFQCAQFLLDNQCRNGQWSYGEPSLYAEDIHTSSGRDVDSLAPRMPVREYEPAGARLKPKVKSFIRVTQKKEGPASGDNSNSQYALLGLRACHEAGIILPPEPIRLAQRWWRDSKHEDPARRPSAGEGWGYHESNKGPAYGSMTAGAVGSLAVCDFLLREDWRKDRALQKGTHWLARHFSVTENPGRGDATQWLHYYLYALERAGTLAGVETFGIHDWYVRGAHALLEAQRPDGSWEGGHPVHDTCFAVLFLRRATRPLVDVATGDLRRR